MQGNLHVPFLGGWAGAIPPGYPAKGSYGFACPTLVNIRLTHPPKLVATHRVIIAPGV